MAHSLFGKLWQRTRYTRTSGNQLLHLPAQFRPRVEGLEERWVLSTVHWINPAGGVWGDAANWSTGAVPGSDDDVVLDAPGAVTVTHAAGDDMLHSIAGADTLVLSGGSLSVADASAFDGPLNLVGGTLSARARLTLNGSFLWTAGTLTGYGTTVANGGLDITGPDPKVLNGALDNAQDGTIRGNSLTLRNGSFQNLPGATLAVDHSYIEAVPDSNDSSGILNLGEMQFLGSCGFWARGVVNGGHMSVEGGSLAMGGSRAQVANNGTIELSGGDFSANGDYFDDTGTIIGAGNFRGTAIEAIGISGAVTAASDMTLASSHVYLNGPAISVGATLAVNSGGISIGNTTIHAGAMNLIGGDFDVDILNSSVSVDSNLSISQRYFWFRNSTVETATFSNGVPNDIAPPHTVFLGTTLMADTVLNQGYLSFDPASTVTIRDLTNADRAYLALAGSISGDLVNAGELAVGGLFGIDPLTVGGNFTQTATGRLDLTIAGRDPDQCSQLDVSGTAYLDGTLAVDAPNSLMEGDSFQALTFGRAGGDFAYYVMPHLGPNLYLAAVQDDGGITLVVQRQG